MVSFSAYFLNSKESRYCHCVDNVYEHLFIGKNITKVKKYENNYEKVKNIYKIYKIL